jgi:OmpA-OmpF porin, OOP family
MLNDRTVGAMGLALALTLWPGLAAAQEAAGGDQLMAMDKGALRSEIARRYDAGLALTRDAAVSAADNPRYLWASQAKAQCGIALGFLKSDAKDPVSIGKCDDAYNRMQLLPAPPQAEVQPTAAACNRVPFIVFFDWNKADLTTDAITALDATGSMLRDCGFPQVALDGYTDRSGSDGYNQDLSIRRADAVRAYLVTHGVPETAIAAQGFGEANPRVSTADGIRELQNRRVEITAK